MLTKQRRLVRSDLGNATKAARRTPDDSAAAARVEELRRQYRAVAAEEYIRELVDSAPPLDAATRDRLALLLRPNGEAA